MLGLVSVSSPWVKGSKDGFLSKYLVLGVKGFRG